MRAIAPLAIVAACLATACGPSPGAVKSQPPACATATVPHRQVTLKTMQTPNPGFQLDSGTQPVGLILDRDGASVWMLGDGPSDVLHVSLDGTAVRYDLPDSELGLQLSQAPDGTVWVPEQYRNAVMAIAPDGTARECRLPRTGTEPVATAVASDGAMWVTESQGGAVARLVGDRWTEHAIGVGGVQGAEVLASRAGGVWFTVDGAPVLGHVSDSGQVTRTQIGGSGTALGMFEAADGSVWVADFGGDRVVRVATGGAVSEWKTADGAKPQSLAAAPDGAIWFTESGADRLARIAGAGVDESYVTGEWPDHIVITADGWAWFTEYYQDAIARFRIPTPLAGQA